MCNIAQYGISFTQYLLINTMKLNINNPYYFKLILLFLVLTGCKSIEPVAFKIPVDTNSKPIYKQTKQTFKLNDVGVYASNKFEAARLNGFEKINDSTAVVIIKPENTPINNSAYYAFKTWSNTAKTFYFKFQYPDGYQHRYIPKLKINNTWRIIDSSQVLKTDNNITVKLNLTKTPILVAAQEVQSSTDVKLWYTNLISQNTDYVKLNHIGQTTLGRDIPVLDIHKGDSKSKDVIVLVTRQHPPEVTGFFAFQKFLETILDGSELSDLFLKKYHIIAFPIMNPDGVDLGHWRHNAGGVDTNRDWSLYRQPEIKNTIAYISKTLKKENAKLILGLDFHSTYEDVFYTNADRKETSLPNFISDWFNALEKNIPNYIVNEKAANSTRPVSKGWFLYGHKAVGITYEIGDKTAKEDIELIGRISAEQMMTILLKTKTNY